MSLLGKGAVAIWHDIAPEGRDEFYEWHCREHMPERVGIPGFLRGRRYVGFDADLEFFNLYETRDAAVVRGDDYRARLNDPTPWTVATVRHFRSVARSLCEVSFSSGTCDGGLMATLRYAVAERDEAAHLAAMTGRILPALAERPGVAGVHMLVADLEASGEVNSEQRARGGQNVVPRFTVLIEGWGDEAPFESALRDSIGEAMAGAGAGQPVEMGFYRHQITVDRHAG